MNNRSRPKLLFEALVLSLIASVSFHGCQSASTREERNEIDNRAEERPAAPEARPEASEKSDLDMPIDEILATVCGHGTLTYQCAECRYEVGMVKVPKTLLESGLIKTVEVSKSAGDAILALTGEVTLNELKAARLSPAAPGIVKKVLVDLGQRVVAAQELLALQSVDLAAAEAEFLDAESAMRLAFKAYERHKELRAAGVTAERELLEAESAAVSARIRMEAARQKLARLGLRESDIETLISTGMEGASGEMVLRAPFAGTVLELRGVAGEQLDGGDAAVLVADLSRLWLWADLYERDLAKVLDLDKRGDVQAVATVQAYPGEEFAGRVDYVGSVLDGRSRTVKVRIVLANPDGRLRPGMFATVHLRLPGRQETLIVPSVAVLSSDGRDFVFIRHDGEYFVRRPVAKGIERNGFTEILLGLEPGQIVVADGAFLLKSDVLRSKMGAGCAD